MLLGSALANMGTCASVVTFHGVAGPVELSKTVGNGVGVGDGDSTGAGDGFRPYWLRVVVRLRLGFAGLFAEIHVLGSLLPWRKEYEYHFVESVGDWYSTVIRKPGCKIRTGFWGGLRALSRILFPGNDILNTTIPPSGLAIGVGLGYGILFHWTLGVGETEVVVTKGVGVGLASKVLIHDASINPSRPGVGVGVDDVNSMLWLETVKTAGKGVTDAAGTLPLCTDGELTIVPKPTLPLTVIRTFGRG
jgi:hypothetical protein